MGLLSLKTNLKSLKFGNDQAGGGSSNQPYIQTPLTANLPPSLDFLTSDFLLRGGPIGAPISTTNDIVRLTKYFTDPKSPSGLLFALKQNLLSRTAVRTQASGKLVNEGIYTPLSTLAQASVSAFGFHFNKQGLNPIPNTPGSLRTYEDVVSGPTINVGNLNLGTNISFLNVTPNRLVDLYKVKQDKTTNTVTSNGIIISQLDTVNILRYQGGPGSILGIGTTNIKFADQRTGLNNPLYKNENTRNAFLRGGVPNPQTKPLEKTIEKTRTAPYAKTTLSGKYAESIYNINEADYNKISQEGAYNAGIPVDQLLDSSNKDNYRVTFNPSVYTSGSIFEPNTEKTNENNTITYNQQDFSLAESYRSNTQNLVDFRAKLRKSFDESITTEQDQKAFNVLSNSPNYNTNKIETRINLGDPGNPFGKNLSSYSTGIGNGAASNNSYDKITSLPLYRSSGVDNNKSINDLIKFRIAAIDNDDPTQKVYIHFRAFLNSISDNYNADWNPSKYVGRGENFYNYSGFDRKISLSFTVAAQSKVELIPMYKKLNYLASNLAPDYSGVGYMRGPLVTLTVGGYLYEQPGFITELSFEMSEETPWEIGINEEGDSDPNVKQLSHIIKVSSFNFTPIHTFIPRKAQWNNLGKTPFIALTNGANTNY